MRIAFLCKRRYMSKDVILDRYARLYEIPFQLARLGHHVCSYSLDYHQQSAGTWEHEAHPGSLRWESAALDKIKVPTLVGYPTSLLRKLSHFQPDLIIGASDIPHAALARWLSAKLQRPYALDLYDNFEGFGQARIPGFRRSLRRAIRDAALVITTSEPLKRKVLEDGAQGNVIAMPSSVDLATFNPGDKVQARLELGLPQSVKLIGTAGGLYKDKGVEPLYAAWKQLNNQRRDVHLVLAGPVERSLPPPSGSQVHYLDQLSHDRVAQLFRALDVGVISVLDSDFSRYCFPQKAYEMLACNLPVAAAGVGHMKTLFQATPQIMFSPGHAPELASVIAYQLEHAIKPDLVISDWAAVMSDVERALRDVVNQLA